MSAFARPLSPCSAILFSSDLSTLHTQPTIDTTDGLRNVINRPSGASNPQPFFSLPIITTTTPTITPPGAQDQYANTASCTKIPSTAKISASDSPDLFTDIPTSWPTQLSSWQPAQTVTSSQFPVAHTQQSATRIEDFVLYPQTATCPKLSAAVSSSSSSGHLQSFGTQPQPVNSPVHNLSATSTQFLQPSLGIAANNLTMMNAADVPLDDSSFNGGAYSSFASPSMPCSVNYTPGSLFNASPNELTVSPSDLMLQGIGSASNSTALTNLTSPNLNESPGELDAYCFSGNVESAGIDSPNPWYPLFPDAQPASAPPSSENSSPQQLSDNGPRSRGNSDTRSPRIGSIRQSDVSGVGARKRNRAQAPIIVDENDPVAMKRARNTLAARKSRERKLERLQELEDEINQLKAERDHWKRLAVSHGATE